MRTDNSNNKLRSFSEVLTDLMNRGYQHKFRRELSCLYCIGLSRWVTPVEFNVDESYYFEESSSPDKDRMIYAITTHDRIRGVLVDAGGIYADNISREMFQKLSGKEKQIDVDRKAFNGKYNIREDKAGNRGTWLWNSGEGIRSS